MANLHHGLITEVARRMLIGRVVQQQYSLPVIIQQPVNGRRQLLQGAEGKAEGGVHVLLCGRRGRVLRVAGMLTPQLSRPHWTYSAPYLDLVFVVSGAVPDVST